MGLRLVGLKNLPPLRTLAIMSRLRLRVWSGAAEDSPEEQRHRCRPVIERVRFPTKARTRI